LKQNFKQDKHGRIFGAKRQKPGFPLQVLGFADANPVGFPLQSLARAPAAEDGRLSALRPLYTAQTFLSLSPVLLVKSHAVRVPLFGRDWYGL
jgi:hypothetical protein